jgi:hypothetical protein
VFETVNHKYSIHKYAIAMLNSYSGQAETQQNWNITQRRSGLFVPIVVSIVGVLIWLIFILFFALFWSKDYSLFQNVVVFIVTLCITGLLLGLMWIIWGRNKIQRWTYRY